MAIDLNWRTIPAREQRLGSITGYDGTLLDMATQGCKGCLQDKRRDFQTASSCAHHHMINQLAGLRDVAVVDHAPIGCVGSQVFFSSGRAKTEPPPGAPPMENVRILSSGINESDTIFGAAEKLKDTVRLAYERHCPREIYIATSCVSAVIGEDVESVAAEMSEELGIPVVAGLGGEGLRSKIWASGFDAYCHAASIARLKGKIPTEDKKSSISYVGFAPMGRRHIESLFKRIGLDLICLTAAASIEDFRRAAESVATWGQCGAQSSYLCGVLEKEFGVKYFQSHLPYGGIGFERFFLDVARFVGREKDGKRVIEEEQAKYLPKIDKIKKKLKGKRVLIAMGASFAYEYTRILGELGMEVLHTVAYHYDPKLDNLLPEERVAAATDVFELKLNVSTSVNDAQQQETNLIVKKYKPDIVLSRAHEAGVFAQLQGIPALDAEIGLIVMGYRGLYRFAILLEEALQTNNLVKKLGERYVSAFSALYEETEPFQFYREESV
jgi:nitrogenase molybdenum-iron protein alpha chain